MSPLIRAALSGGPADLPPGEPAATPVVVHLVHGTWPDGLLASWRRGLRRGEAYPDEAGAGHWFQSDHPFRTGLAQALRDAGFDPQVRAFVWSGANSFAARAVAAEEFAPHLVRGMRDGTRQLVVAHSHGGTVAMLAAGLLASGATPDAVPHGETLLWAPVRRRSGRAIEIAAEDVVMLDAAAARRGAGTIELVTLATPFLRVERFTAGGLLWNAFATCAVFASAVVAIGLARWRGEALGYAWMAVFGVVAGLAGRAVAASARFVERTVIAAQATRFVGRRIQCLRGVADEAELAIGAGIVGCNIVRAVLVAAGRVLGRVPTWLALAGIAGLLGLLAWAFVAPPGAGILAALYLPAALAAAAILVLVGASALQGLLGVELGIAGFQWLTMVESTPDAGSGQIEIGTLVGLRDGDDRLRHAVYLHPDCIGRIVAGVVAGGRDAASARPQAD